MHAGELSRAQIQGWTLNRYYYQTRIPIKDALILSKSEDPRVSPAVDPSHPRPRRARAPARAGSRSGSGSPRASGSTRREVASLARVLPAVRFACDAYVQLVRERSLVEAVASSLTEFFSPDIMATRLAAWEKHYPWVDPGVQEYFRSRVPRARADSGEAIDFVIDARDDARDPGARASRRSSPSATSSGACSTPSPRATRERRASHASRPPPPARGKVRLKHDAIEKQFVLLYPERGMKLTRERRRDPPALRRRADRRDDRRGARARDRRSARGGAERDVAAFLDEMKKRGLLARSS